MTRCQRLRVAFDMSDLLARVLNIVCRFSRVERLRREMRQSADGQRDLGTRHDLLLGTRTAMCRYHPDNGGTGREPGDPRHFEDYVEDILGPEWGDDEAAARYQAGQWVGVRGSS